jgi:hypothetical protein
MILTYVNEFCKFFVIKSKWKLYKEYKDFIKEIRKQSREKSFINAQDKPF